VRRLLGSALPLGLAAAGLLTTAGPAAAQFRTSSAPTLTSGFGLSGGSGIGSAGASLGGTSFGGLGSSGFGSSGLGSSGFGSSGFGSSGFGSSSGGFGFGNTGSSMGAGARGGNIGASASFRPGTAQYGSSSFLGAYYGNPLSLGLVGSNGQVATTATFGQPLYNTTSGAGLYGNTGGYGALGGRTTGLGALGGRGVGALGALGGSGALGGQGGTASVATGAQNFTPAGVGVVRRAPAAVASLGFSYTPPPASQLVAGIQDVIARSSQLPSKNGIQVALDGPVVVLQGTVADDAERSLAEGMIRLTPGVHDVRNELVVRGTGP
jgi:hypothetical protein